MCPPSTPPDRPGAGARSMAQVPPAGYDDDGGRKPGLPYDPWRRLYKIRWGKIGVKIWLMFHMLSTLPG